jgi:hypothetical protein
MTREDRFKGDFANRFFGLKIVSEESRKTMSPLLKMQTCSEKEIKAWIDQWVIENAGLDEEVMNLYLYSIEATCKAAQIADNDRRRRA